MKGLPTPQLELIALAGGYDQVTPTLSLRPGFFRRGANFECSINGGYTRIAGYEAFDGRPNPSAARYTVLTVTLTATVSVGDTVEGVTSGATGKVLLAPTGELVLTKVVGEFDFDGEDLEVSSSPVGSLTTYTTMIADALTDAQYRSLAANNYRADIGAVPGSGTIRGVEYYKGDVYAWRDNAGGTAMDIYKSSSGGWTPISLGRELVFTAGTVAIAEGATVVGATSGATGVVARVTIESGTVGAGTAAGRMVLTGVTGTFGTEVLNVSAAPVANTTGGAVQITLAPGGRVQTVVANFGGGVNNRRIYGCDGVNRAFEFDGVTLVPISTGMTVDKPDNIVAHKLHLFLSFGSSLQFSSINQPRTFNVITGAGEIAMNDNITVLQVLPGDQTNGALAVYTERETAVLYGSSSSNFLLTTFNVEGSGGAYRYTGGNLDQGYVLSNHGVTGLATTLNFGNFASAALTMKIRPFVQRKKGLATASMTNTEKGQYRVFFSDGTGLYLTLFNGKLVGISPIQFDVPVMCACNGENADNGVEVHYFGSTDGFVYRLDAGTSFNGAPIPASFSLNFSGAKSTRQIKAYLKASVEVTGDGYAEFDLGYSLGYASPDIEQPFDVSETTDLRSAYWDEFVWDDFVWDGRGVSPNEIPLYGSAENISITIASNSELFKPFTMNSIILHYMPRRGLR